MPDLCTPAEVESFRKANRQVDIVSPNSEELGGFFIGRPLSEADMAAQVLEWGIGSDGNGALVVREGKNGCSAFSRGYQIHLRAYHDTSEDAQSRVVDPTGGGNAFLGALAMALSGDTCPQKQEVDRLLVLDKSLTLKPNVQLAVSLIYATIAASFVIEQPGVPSYLAQGDSGETWNDESFGHRLRAYLSRERAYITRQIKQ
jgi:sugar/nucleoside kinase (ribokinase family)